MPSIFFYIKNISLVWDDKIPCDTANIYWYRMWIAVVATPYTNELYQYIHHSISKILIVNFNMNILLHSVHVSRPKLLHIAFGCILMPITPDLKSFCRQPGHFLLIHWSKHMECRLWNVDRFCSNKIKKKHTQPWYRI